jgi:hypothetical protein
MLVIFFIQDINFIGFEKLAIYLKEKYMLQSVLKKTIQFHYKNFFNPKLACL